jgi:hypothetical protein
LNQLLPAGNFPPSMKAAFISVCWAVAIGSLAVGAEPAGGDARPDADGFLRHWLLFAPIYLEEDTPGHESLDRNQVAKEAALQPKAGDKLRVQRRELVWTGVQTKDAVFDFNAALGEQHDWTAGYLVTYVHCDREMTGLNLLVGHNDQARVYLNGREVFRHELPSTLSKDSGKVENVTLKQGVNTIVFKVLNEINNWQACLRFTDREGKPVTGFTVKLSP